MRQSKASFGQRGFSESGMRNIRWREVLGTIGLHIVAIGLVWSNTSRAPFPVHQAGIIEIQLHAPSTGDEAGDDAVAEVIPAISATEPIVAESEAAIVEKTAILENPLVLPPKEEPYLPASEADTRPQPEGPVIVPYPDYTAGKPKGTVILVLYIDEAGEVKHAELEKSELPQIFGQTAIDAFMKARMQPAIKQGKAVKARMRIMVEFEAT